MQAGLLDVYSKPIRNRRAAAWLLSALLVAFYVDLYFFDHLAPVAQALHLLSKERDPEPRPGPGLYPLMGTREWCRFGPWPEPS